MAASGYLAQGDVLSVLHHARSSGGTTRADLGRSLDLGRSAVTQRVGTLVDLGLLEEGESSTHAVGRRPRELRFRGEAGLVLVGNLGAKTFAAGIADLSGILLAEEFEGPDVAAGPETVLAALQQVWTAQLDKVGAARERLWGAGLGLPGPVEFATGRPIAPPIMPGWDAYPVREQLADAFGVPVWVDNEVNLETLGEATAGLGRAVDDMLFVKMSIGIGSGILSRGRLHRGAQGAAGDIGHIAVVDDATMICGCGNTGCLEAVAGGDALVRSAKARVGLEHSTVLKSLVEAGEEITVSILHEANNKGDPLAMDVLVRAGRLVGETLSMLVNFYNPALLVIGGRLVHDSDLVLSTVRETIYGRSLPLATRDLVIGRSELSLVGGLVGAVTMVVDELLRPARFEVWSHFGTPHGHPELASSS